MTDRYTETAESCARGHYQMDVLYGRAALSGADLRGAAGRYAGRYAESRYNLIQRLREAGVPVAVTRGKRGKLRLTWGEDAVQGPTTETYAGAPLVEVAS